MGDGGSESSPLPLIDIVKAAATSISDTNLGSKKLVARHCPCSFVLQPLWEDRSEDNGDDNGTHYLGGLIQKLEVSSDKGESLKLAIEQEDRFVRKLTRLKRKKNLNVEEFYSVLKDYLHILTENGPRGAKEGEGNHGESKKPECNGNDAESHSRGEASVKKKSVGSLLRTKKRWIGNKVITEVLDTCFALELWDPIKLFIEYNLVSVSVYPLVVEKLVDSGQAWLLCLCAHHIHDLRPSQLLQMLQFFLCSGAKWLSKLKEVRQRLKAENLSAIHRLGKDQQELKKCKSILDAQGAGSEAESEVLVSEAPFHLFNLKKKSLEASLCTAIKLANAYDKFSASEICIHYLVSVKQDEAVLSSIVRQLETNEALKLLSYLSKWLYKYSGPLATMHQSTRVASIAPAFSCVMDWMAVLLEGHYTTLVLCPEFWPELKRIKECVPSYALVASSMGALTGIVAHIKSGALPPAEKTGFVGADHIIEFLPIN